MKTKSGIFDFLFFLVVFAGIALLLDSINQNRIASNTIENPRMINSSIPLNVMSDHTKRSQVLAWTLSTPIIAVYDDGQSCWVAVKVDNVIGWVNADQLSNKSQLCWTMGRPTATSDAQCYNGDCFK